MRQILITGGMGFIGKNLTWKLLLEGGNHVTIVDNLSSSFIDPKILKNPNVKFYQSNFEKWMPDKGIKYSQIYHLTSPVGPLGVLKYKGNIAKMILEQLYHASEMAIKMEAKLLEISTSEVYGCHPEDELGGQREDINKIVPSNLTVRLEYGVAKLLCEIVLKNLSRDNRLKYICIRPFNIVGPKQNEELGFIIPRFIKQVISGDPITVYGDGSQKRTLTHVQDFVDAIYLAMESTIDGEVYNVGNPNNICTVNQIANKVSELFGGGRIEYVDPTKLFKDFSEAWNKIPNIEKIVSHLGWYPKYNLDYIFDEIKNKKITYLN